MGDIGGNARSIDDVVQSQLLDERRLLEQKRKRLTDTTGSTAIRTPRSKAQTSARWLEMGMSMMYAYMRTHTTTALNDMLADMDVCGWM